MAQVSFFLFSFQYCFTHLKLDVGSPDVSVGLIFRFLKLNAFIVFRLMYFNYVVVVYKVHQAKP